MEIMQVKTKLNKLKIKFTQFIEKPLIDLL